MAKKKAKGKKPVRPLVGAGGVLKPTGINFLIKTRDLLKGKKGFQKEGGIIKASEGKMTPDISKRMNKIITSDKVSDFTKKRMAAGDRGAFNQVKKRALKAARATRIGKIAAGVAGAALLAKSGLEKLYEKRTGKKPFTKQEKKRTLVDKKMGGGLTEATRRLRAQGLKNGGKMTESDLQKKVDRDARINKARKSIKKLKEKDAFQTALAQNRLRRQREMAQGKVFMTDKELQQRMRGMSKGGMCRGMGAAIRGGDFKGVK